MTDNYNKRDRTYDIYHDWMMKEIDSMQDEFILGKETDKKIGLFSMFHLLMQLRNENYASVRPSADQVDCMSDILFCHGILTEEMEQVYPPSYNGDPLDDKDPVFLDDGIDYMQIQGNGKDYPLFRIS